MKSTISRKIHNVGRVYEGHGGRNLLDRARAAKNDLVITEPDPDLAFIPETLDVLAANRSIEYAATNSDLVVLGKVRFQFSSLNSSQTSVFTLVPFDVQEIIKSHRNVKEGGQITVVRPGGRMRVNGRKVIVNVENFSNFRGGAEYLLFLKYNSDCDSYMATASNSFLLLENEVKSLTGRRPNPAQALFASRSDFLAAVRSISAHSEPRGRWPVQARCWLERVYDVPILEISRVA